MIKILPVLFCIVLVLSLTITTDAIPVFNNFEPVTEDFPEAVQKIWVQFKSEFKRDYKNALEESRRFHIFAANYLRSIEHNMKYLRNETSYMLGVNKFSDRTQEEMRKIRGYRPSMKSNLEDANKGSLYYTRKFIANLPDTVDWRKKGAVTPVKVQGDCASSWAFSTTGSVEGQHFRKTKTLVNLSEQQLVDCSSSYGNNGCDGGAMDQAFNYIKENGGDDTEESYPYVASTKGQGSCKFNPSTVGATVTGFMKLPSGDEEALKEAVATIGPISVAIFAGLQSFDTYHKGVYDDPLCFSDLEYLDHGVLVVGYGTENGKDYWLVKNSWGTHFGENGYIKIRRNHNNTCGVATAALFPLV